MVSTDENAMQVSEFVLDREVESVGEDRLGHALLAEELANLALGVATTSNIALYGAWGSGKSGIGKMLQENVARRAKKDARFVRFDAFKFAEAPLRRNFISATAYALDITDDRFHKKLYANETTKQFDVPGGTLCKIVLSFLAFLVLIVTLSFGIILVIAAFLTTPFGADVSQMTKQTVTTGIGPAALLAALLAYSANWLASQTVTEKASTDEEFESIFKTLRLEAKTARLVIFIDELDRCSAEDVVATLDSVRTFFGVPGTVFVVAADQAAVENALNDAIKQTTPLDLANPYYSTGSAYLDKIFQYQIAVPPLLPQGVTKFAADLVRSKPGIWQAQNVDSDYIISILIPSHVRSPRRVKTLINSFVATVRYALALERAGRLDTEVLSRVDEIARLVCIRTEFPSFFRELPGDPQLIAAIVDPLDSGDEGEGESGISSETRRLAQSFASGQLASAELLIDSDAQGTATKSVYAAHGQQLVRYLRRTRMVNGPRKDILHMQSTGSLFGISEDIARSLIRYAEDGASRDFERVLSSRKNLSHESVVELLLQQLQHESVGVEAANVVQTVLTSGLDLNIVRLNDVLVDLLVLPIANLAKSGRVRTGLLERAWSISLNSERSSANEIRKTVMQQQVDSMDSDGVGLAVVASYELAKRSNASAAQSIFRDMLLTDPSATVLRILETADTVATDALLADLSTSLVDILTHASSDAEDGEEDLSGPGSSSEEIAGELGLWLDELLTKDISSGERLLQILLSANSKDARDVVERRMRNMESVGSASTAKSILAAVRNRQLGSWPIWLTPVANSSFGQSERDGLEESLNAAAATMWTMLSTSTDLSDNEISEYARSLTRMPFISEYVALTQLVLDTLSAPVSDDDSARTRRFLLALIRSTFVDLISPRSIYQRESEHLVATLANTGAASTEDILSYLRESVTAVGRLSAYGKESFDRRTELKSELVTAITGCGWLSETQKVTFDLLACSSFDIPNGTGSDPITMERLLDLRRDHGSALDEAIALWIEVTDDTNGMADLLREMLAGQLVNQRILGAIREYNATRLDEQDRLSLAFELIDGQSVLPSDRILDALSVTSLKSEPKADLVKRRFEKSNTNAHRQETLELWEKLQITKGSVQRDLIQEVFIPILDTKRDGRVNKGAVEAALRALPRLGVAYPSQPLRGKLSAKVAEVTAGGGTSLKDLGVEALESIGYTSRVRRFFLLTTKEIDSD